MSVKVTAKTISKKCPPKLRALLKATGYSYQKTADITGLSKSYIANIARGQKGQAAGPKANERFDAALARLKSGEAAAPVVPLSLRKDTIQGSAEQGLAICFAVQKRLPAPRPGWALAGGLEARRPGEAPGLRPGRPGDG